MTARRMVAAVVAIGVWAAALAATPVHGASILKLRDGATDPATAKRLQAANDWWQQTNPGQVPCRKCEMRPPGSNLLWVYYRRQGFFPNWVSAARDLLRRERAGEVEPYRAGVAEIVSYSARRTSPSGIVYRINDSPYLSPDSTAPPWRDAMGQGLVLTLFVPTLGEDSTAADRAAVKTLATEYLNAFSVDWKDGGVATNGTAGGSWYLEYATERGNRARVLNGFMQSLVSLDRFATQADSLAANDPDWARLRDRAREHVRLGALEVDAHLPEYDLGNGISKYSLLKPDPAPPVYQTFHRQLLLRLQNIEYLPKEWRANFDRMRISWGGEDFSGGVPWWGWVLIGFGSVAAILAALRLRARRRLARRRLQRA